MDVDHGSSGHEAAATLLALGHRSLALFNTSPRYTYSGHCEQGFHAALVAFGGSVESVVVDGGMTEESAAALAREMFSLAGPPTTFVCGNDAMALGVMHAIAERGLRVGVDVSVIGCNDIPVGRFVSPGLSSFAAPIEDVGRALVEFLHRQMHSEVEPPEAKVFAPVFVPRGSHGRR